MTSDAPSFASWQRVSAGTRLNGIYEIDQPIAAGGMGEVYKGHVIETGDPVAIKLMLPELAENQAAMTLFRKEASALHHVHHDAIVRYYVFTVEPVLRRPYLAFEFVDGRTLSNILHDGGPLTFEAARTLLHRLASGLQAAHEHNIVHRDMSPDNVMIPYSDVARAKIIDFGIARSNQHGTVIGSGFAGKFSYVSPEQLGLFGGDVTPKSDIYSLGLVTVESLTGQPLDMGGSHLDVIEKRRKVPDLGAIDMRIRPLLEKMLQPDPAQRPESMAAVAAWSLGAAPSAPRSGKSLDSAPRPKKAGARRWRLVAALLLLAAGGGAAGLYLLPSLLPPSAPPVRSARTISSFVDHYNGGNCFFVAPVPGAVSEKTAAIEGLGSAARPFDEFDKDFQRVWHFAANIDVRLVTEKQCPAITFLAGLREERERAPHLDIDRDSLHGSDVLSGVVDHYGKSNIDLILVSDAGKAWNVSNMLRAGTDAKTFSIPMQRFAGAPGRQPQLLITLAASSPIDTLPPGQMADGEQVFPRLLGDAARTGKPLSATARYFTLER
jgi:serine/threonine protein kinase